MRARTILRGLLAAGLVTAAAASCAKSELPGPSNTTTTTTTKTETGTTTTTTTDTTSSTSSTSTGFGGSPFNPDPVWGDCEASDQSWVRRAILAIAGRRPLSQAEVNALEDAVRAIRAAAPAPKEGEPDPGRRAVARALMQENAFRERWSDFLMDALRVNRIELKSQQNCYGPPLPDAVDDGSLARYVRDNDPKSTAAPIGQFGMGDLLSSALALDDLSVVYRGNLFAMMNLPISGANVGPEAMERIQRQDFGAAFATAYIHRDIVCLNCHNSEYAVTFDEDPALNRHWAVPGLFELALYGDSSGRHPIEEAATKGSDELRAYSMFRVMNVVGGGSQPWGWGFQCGSFQEPNVDDPLHIDAFFGSVRSTPAAPNKGLRASIWDVERALHRGVDRLAQSGLVRGPDGTIADPDDAFAYLVAENIAEKVWDEVMGHRLTIANYFPRNQISRDTLAALTDRFVASHFSLKTLLDDIVAHRAFNLKSPDADCGDAAYALPNLFDPWSIADADPSKRPNSPADGVFALSARPLVRSLHRTMGWPYLFEYPGDDPFQVAIGIFLKDGDPGFRGLDFQGRLTWENAYGRCQDQSFGSDFIAKLVTDANSKPGTTVEDAVIALKDRLIGEPFIDPSERPALELLAGSALSSTDLSGLDTQLRSVCGVLVSAPQFMLGGVVAKDTHDIPKLTPKGAGYADACAALSKQMGLSGQPFDVKCEGDTLSASAK